MDAAGRAGGAVGKHWRPPLTKSAKGDIQLETDELLFEAADEQTLRQMREHRVAKVRLLWNERSFLVQTTLVGLVLATAVAFLIPKRYTSTARLMPPDQGAGQGSAMLAALAGRAGGTLANLAEGALGMNTNGDLFVGVLESDTVNDDLIKKFNLQKLYRDRYIEDARKHLAKQTEISEDAKSGIIVVAVTDHDPERAAQMAQEYVNELNWVVTHLSTSTAHRERVFLDERLNQVKADLESDEHQFSQFASQKGAVDISEQGKAMVTAAAALQGQLIAAESELEGLRQFYTDNNVRVRSMQARVNDLRKALEKIGGKGADEHASVQQLYPSLRELPLLGVEYADLLRRTKVQEAVFEALTQEDELSKVQEAKEIPSVRVLDSPEVPQEKSSTARPLVIFVGAFLAFAAGTAWILCRSAWESIDANDPRKLMATEIWADIRAYVPRMANNGSFGDQVER
jgi:uncharacterized protein involved in exopolysaccharide biosynthesis